MTHSNRKAAQTKSLLRVLLTATTGLAAFACSPQDVVVQTVRALNSNDTAVDGQSNQGQSNDGLANDGRSADGYMMASNSSGSAGQSAFVKAVDPKEQAFSVAVPKGWQTRLGMERTGGQPRSWVETVSPDGKTRVFAGDTRMPLFVEPTSDVANVTAQANNPMMRVAQYTPAQQFGANYLQQSFAQAPGFKILAAEPNPQLQNLATKRAAESGVRAQVEAASLRFQYQHEGSTARGKLLVATYRLEGMWAADVSGFTTTQDPRTADKALQTLVASYETNPAWRQKEQQRNQQAMQQSQANHQARMAANQARFNAHQQKMKGLYAAADQRNQAWMNNFRDDSSHQQFMGDLRGTSSSHDQFIDYIRDEQQIGNGDFSAKVDAGYDRYWVNETDNTWIGTNGPDDLQVDGYDEWNEQN